MTQQTKHTPAPWHMQTLSHQSITGHDICIIHGVTTQPTEDGKGQRYCYISADKPCFEVSDEEQLANAYLIAAAPDLLAALEQAVTSMQDSGYPNDHLSVKAARAAIAKAKGSAA